MEYTRSGLARSTGFIVVLAALLCGGSASTHAGSENSRRPSSVSVPAPESAAAEERQTARYFTINQVLAKLDRQRQGSNSLQLASLDTPAVNDAAPFADGGEEPFGYTTFRAPEGLLWAKWRKLEVELADEAQVLAQCRRDAKSCANPAALKYLSLIEESRRLPERSRIARINRAINGAVRYTSDLEQHGVPDLWTAPLATLGAGRGDCEDYAIAKYVALRDADFSPDDLRLLIVRDSMARQDHAVVGVRQDGRWLMLDNRHDILLEPKDARHLTPLFALDRQGVKLFAVPYDKHPASTPAQVAADQAHKADRSEPASTNALEALGAESLGLRLDAFDPPALRGGL